MPALRQFQAADPPANLSSINSIETDEDTARHDSYQGTSISRSPVSAPNSVPDSHAAAAAAAAAVAAASGHSVALPPMQEGSIASSQRQSGHVKIDQQDSSDASQAQLTGIGKKEPTPSAPTTLNGGQSGNRRVYECHVCGWQFALKGNLVAHLRRHTGEKPYVCTICNRKFTQSSLLTVHMRTHTGEKPFKCTKCGRSFSRSGNLTTHMRTHNQLRPYQCAFCHKTFSQRVNMELHTRVHTGVKPYRCGVCNRAFTSCSNMRRHWRQLHPSFPEPAMGTLHLLNGMPEKALYSGPPRPNEYRSASDPEFQEEARVGENGAPRTDSIREPMHPPADTRYHPMPIYNYGHGHAHDQGHDHSHAHDHEQEQEQEHEHDHGHDHGHDHEQLHSHHHSHTHSVHQNPIHGPHNGQAHMMMHTPMHMGGGGTSIRGPHMNGLPMNGIPMNGHSGNSNVQMVAPPLNGAHSIRSEDHHLGADHMQTTHMSSQMNGQLRSHIPPNLSSRFGPQIETASVNVQAEIDAGHHQPSSTVPPQSAASASAAAPASAASHAPQHPPPPQFQNHATYTSEYPLRSNILGSQFPLVMPIENQNNGFSLAMKEDGNRPTPAPPLER